MIRLALRVFALTWVATATTAYAADAFFGTTTPTTTNSTSTGRFKSRLSPDNYLNSVQQLNLQTNNSLNQQVKDLYPKKGTAPAIANQPTGTVPTQPAGSITISNPPPQPSSAQQTAPTTRPSGTYQSPMTTQPPAQQTDTYTGFGGGSRGTTAPGNSGSSTGLGIKY